MVNDSYTVGPGQSKRTPGDADDDDDDDEDVDDAVSSASLGGLFSICWSSCARNPSVCNCAEDAHVRGARARLVREHHQHNWGSMSLLT